MSAFGTWLNTFIEEKGIDLSEPVIAKCGARIQCGDVIQAMHWASPGEQRQIKATLVAIDFRNGDVMHFVRHLAKAMDKAAFDAIKREAFGGAFAD